MIAMNRLVIDNNTDSNDIVVDVDTDMIVNFDNTEKELTIHITDGVCFKGFINGNNTKNKIKYYIGENCNIYINKISIDCSDDVSINMNYKNSKIKYNTSIINYKDNIYRQELNHKSSDTESDILNHCINIDNSEFKFVVDGVIDKNITGVKLNQDNKIINLKEGKSAILPNLLVDSDDVEASHAAYVGTFDEESRFYMMSRGLTKEECDDLLIKAFLINNMSLNEKERDIFCSIIEKINK